MQNHIFISLIIIIVTRIMHNPGYVPINSDIYHGTGAKFILEWGYIDSVNTPMIQAVMNSTASTQRISFVTESVIIDRSDHK